MTSPTSFMGPCMAADQNYVYGYPGACRVSSCLNDEVNSAQYSALGLQSGLCVVQTGIGSTAQFKNGICCLFKDHFGVVTPVTAVG